MESYELLLKGGHLIDPAQGIDGNCDVAIRDGRIARVGADLDSRAAVTVVDVRGFYVTPGLIDAHAHCFAGNDRYGLTPDDHALPNGVTTIVDAGSAGWRNFEHFRRRIVDHSKCRVLALLNIVGLGMEDQANEQNQGDMDVAATAAAAREHGDLIVAIKTAHYRQPDWLAIDRALSAAERSGLPGMFDVEPEPGHPYDELLARLRPGDIATHMYGPHLPTLDAAGRVFDYVWQARERGVRFDLGHGAGSFVFRIAVPCHAQGFLPDAISTDLHRMSVHGPVFSMGITISKLLNLGLPLSDIIARSTVGPAQMIGRPELGTLAAGSEADVAVWDLRHGQFGYWDSRRTKMIGDRKLECVMTLRTGTIVYDLHGLALPD